MTAEQLICGNKAFSLSQFKMCLWSKPSRTLILKKQSLIDFLPDFTVATILENIECCVRGRGSIKTLSVLNFKTRYWYEIMKFGAFVNTFCPRLWSSLLFQQGHTILMRAQKNKYNQLVLYHCIVAKLKYFTLPKYLTFFSFLLRHHLNRTTEKAISRAPHTPAPMGVRTFM